MTTDNAVTSAQLSATSQITLPLIYFCTGHVSRLVIVPSPLELLQLRPCTCRYPLIFTLWYTKIKGLHKTGKSKTEKNICPLFGNIRNGNTQKWEIRENCHTEKLAILQYWPRNHLISQRRRKDQNRGKDITFVSFLLCFKFNHHCIQI